MPESNKHVFLSSLFYSCNTLKQQSLPPKCFQDGHIYIPGLKKIGFKIHEKLRDVFSVLLNYCTVKSKNHSY